MSPRCIVTMLDAGQGQSTDLPRVATEHPVLLVTADKGFYKGRDYEQGLAENLLAEARATACGVTVVHKLSLVLEKIHVVITVDCQRLGAWHTAGERGRD